MMGCVLLWYIVLCVSFYNAALMGASQECAEADLVGGADVNIKDKVSSTKV